jgi:hypothetical protein
MYRKTITAAICRAKGKYKCDDCVKSRCGAITAALLSAKEAV